MPLFSVLIANYNNGIFIDTAIKSVLKQTYDDWELVIIDDHSTDSSFQILSQYVHHKKIRVYRNNYNKGVAYSKSRAIQLAQGSILGFLDSDDTLVSNAIEVMVEAFNKHPDCGLIYSTHYVCDCKLQVIKIADYVGLLPQNDFLITKPNEKSISHFVTFKIDTYNKTEGISVEMKKAVDRDMYYLLEEQGPVFYIDMPLYFYRHHTNNISLGGTNDYLAMLWDNEAKRKAYSRRISGNHPMYLRNRKYYNEQYLGTTFMSIRHLTKRHRLRGYGKAYLTYFYNSKWCELSIYKMISVLIPDKIKLLIINILNHKLI